MRTLLVSAAIFFAALCVALVFLNRAERSVRKEQYIALENALRRAAVTCYALEGRYPPTLTYLSEHYGVAVDAERYGVRYDAFAPNVMPDIEVYPMGKEENGSE
jgi:hypothetical protein